MAFARETAMYSQLAGKLVLDNVNLPQTFSPPVAMEGNNCAQWEAVIFVCSATSVTIAVQVSNDMQTWRDHTETTGIGVGYKSEKTSGGVAHAYARLRYALVGTGVAILAAGLNTSFQ
jgi:hypothetical protein